MASDVPADGSVILGFPRLATLEFLSLSGGFMPCWHLRPSSGREHVYSHNYTFQSGDEDYLMNETRRKHTTGT